DFALVSPRCDQNGGWTIQMVNDVINHPAVMAMDQKRIHIFGFSLGAGIAAKYLLTSQPYAERFATAHIAYMTQQSGNAAGVAAAKVKVVGISSPTDTNGGTQPKYTRDFIASLTAVGATASLKEYNYGGHGGALPEYMKDQRTYDFMKNNPRAGATPIQPPQPTKTITKVVIYYSDGTTVEQK